MKTIFKRFLLSIAGVSLLTIYGCGGGAGGDTPSTGNNNVGAPSSIIAKTVVQTVTRNDGSVNILGVGKKATYNFIDANTILGEGLHTLPTTSWSYSLRGNEAKVNFGYSVGYANDTWVFTSPSGGTYRSETGLNTGTKGWHEGTFTVSEYTGKTGTGSPGNGAGTGGGNATGQIAVWSGTASGGDISVFIDNTLVGTLTRYYTSTPNCGDSGTVTKTLPIGTHIISGKATGGTSWGPTNVTITAGGCLTVEF